MLAGIGWRVERAMGIEYIARALAIYSNHSVASVDKRCVRFLCEKHCHTSQRQPMPANAAFGSGHTSLATAA